MNRLPTVLPAIFLNFILCGQAAVLVNDTWQDGTRTDPASPAYSENGTDADSDGNLESAWYFSGSSGTTMTASVGHLITTVGANSSSWTTYFTPEASPVTLANAGDALQVTWVFSPATIGSGISQNFRLAVVDSPSAARLTGNGSPGSGTYAGYAMFMNMATTLGGSTPFELMERIAPGTGSAFLSSGGSWTGLANGAASGNTGYAGGTQYTFVMTITRNVANGLDIVCTMTGGSLNNTSLASVSYTDSTPNSFVFDTFGVRPSSANDSAASFDTTLFKVESIFVATAPSITTQPTNQTALAGSNATFTVLAGGSAPLTYQWFFNTNTVLPGATNFVTLTNVQPTNAGSYFVIVTNSSGSITSEVATLTVTTNMAPSITTQPQSQSILAGQSVVFTVAADGNAPLQYQWFFNNSSPLANATNSTLTLTNVQATNAGGYSVIVTNNGGSATSVVATLTVVFPGTTPNFDMIGFATLSGFASNGTLHAGGTTGGAGGAHVQVWTVIDFVNNLQSSTPLMVEVMTNMDLSVLANHSGGFPADYPTGEILVRSDKTIYSKNGATISRGSLRIGKTSLGVLQNVIIRNLKFRDLWVFDPSGDYDIYGWDYVHLENGTHHVWVDHCDFDQVYDGMVDATHACDYLTVSWCVFRNQKKCSLIGHSDNNAAEDTGHLNVTFHHNWYTNVDERMPRMRFGNAHVFNLYSDNLGGNGIQSTCDAATLVENVYFYHPDNGSLPTREENGGPTGTVKVVNSIIVNLPGVNVQFRQFGETNFQFNAPFAGPTPPYPYTLDAVTNVPNVVKSYAGVGEIGFELWQMEQFTSQQLTNAAISGAAASPAGDGVPNLAKYALGLPPFAPAVPPLILFQFTNAQGILTYTRPTTASDVLYRVKVSSNLLDWTESGVLQQPIFTGTNGLQTWEGRYTGGAVPNLFFRLTLQR